MHLFNFGNLMWFLVGFTKNVSSVLDLSNCVTAIYINNLIFHSLSWKHDGVFEVCGRPAAQDEHAQRMWSELVNIYSNK